MPSGWISQRGLPGRDRRADLEHVGAEDLLLAGRQMVGVVLHERGPTRLVPAHRLDGGQQDRGLPVALAAESVAIGHQSLHRDTGQLAQAAEVLEIGGEGAEVAGLQELAQPQLDPRGVAQ